MKDELMPELFEGAPVPTHEIKTDKRKILLWFLGDMHLGHKNFDLKKFKEYLDWAQTRDDLFIIGMGDYLESAIPTALPQAMWDQLSTPEEQKKILIELLRPLKEKIIGLLTGNHELRIWIRTNIDPTKLLCKELGCRYLGHGGYLILKINDQEYRLALFHGYGTTQKKGYHLKKVIETVGMDDADIVCIGHSHQLYHEVWARWRIQNGRVIKHYIHGIRTGGFLRYPDYAKRLLYAPPIIGSPLVVLYTKQKRISVDISGKLPTGY